MGDVYDLFSKEKVKQPRASNFTTRYKQCLKRMEENGFCDCQLCVDKSKMSKRLFDIVRYLCKDYTDKTGRVLYVADALEMVLHVAASLKEEVKK